MFYLSFAPATKSSHQAYTILESSTKAVFMHLTTSEFPAPYWGVIMKSNWNGTYFGVSADNVNRNDRGFVDFEKMIGLDGIAVINVVSNTQSARITGRKELQTRITHNDGMPMTRSLDHSLTSSQRRLLETFGTTSRRLPRKDIRMHLNSESSSLHLDD